MNVEMNDAVCVVEKHIRLWRQRGGAVRRGMVRRVRGEETRKEDKRRKER